MKAITNQPKNCKNNTDFKSGSKTLPGNFRPTSLLSNLNKIIKKVIYSHLFFFSKINVLNNFQFGFRNNHSITLSFSEFVEGVLLNFDKGHTVCAVFMDLSKAFESVDRNVLLRKVECYGVTGNVHLLISSSLDGMKQFVSFGGQLKLGYHMVQYWDLCYS